MTDAPERLGTWPERLLAFLLAAYALVSAWDFSGRPACIDYYQFWVVGRAVAAKETRDVYSDAERKRLGEVAWQRALADATAKRAAESDAKKSAGSDATASPTPTKQLQAARQRRELETYSTPWFYTVFGLVSGADYDRSQDVFQRASLVAYVAAILLLARMLGFSFAGAALVLAALLQWFNPFVDDVIAGNVNRIQLFVLAVFLWLECRARIPGRHVLAGALLGALLAFKPNLLAVAAVFVLGLGVAGEGRRLVRSLAGQLVGVIGSVLASAWFFGSFAPWTAWLAEFPRLMAAGSPAAGNAGEGNYSLGRLLHDSAGVTLGPAPAIVLVLATIAALVVERLGRKGAADDSDRSRSPNQAPLESSTRAVLLVGIGAALSLLATELAWQHYFIAVVPLALFLLRPASDSFLAAALALAALAMVALQNVGRLFDLHQPASGAAVVAGGTLALFVLGLLALVRLKEA